jgi:hypothetical protein
MPGISRRRFLRDASVGAAAVGTMAVVGPSAFGLTTASSAAASTLASHSEHGSVAARGSGDEIMAHVVDEASGKISLYSGTRMVTIQDRAVTDAFLKALR